MSAHHVLCKKCGRTYSPVRPVCPFCNPKPPPTLSKPPIPIVRQVPLPAFICQTCGHSGSRLKRPKGSGPIEFILWFLFSFLTLFFLSIVPFILLAIPFFLLLPPLFYSIWRRSNCPYVCYRCSNPTVIPIDSPAAQRLLADLSTKAILPGR